MRTYVLTAGLLLMMPFCGLAQANVSEQFINDKALSMAEALDYGYTVLAFNNHDSSTKGSPMLLPRWRQGTILLATNKAPKEAVLKYDVYNQQLRVRRPQGDSIAISLKQVQKFTFTDIAANGQMQVRQFVRCEGALAGPTPAVPFAEIISQGEQVQLLKVWAKSLDQLIEKTSYAGSGTAVKYFADKQQYYLKLLADNRMVSLRPKRNALKEALAGQPAMLQRLESYNSSITNEAELVAALSAIDPPAAATLTK